MTSYLNWNKEHSKISNKRSYLLGIQGHSSSTLETRLIIPILLQASLAKYTVRSHGMAFVSKLYSPGRLKCMKDSCPLHRRRPYLVSDYLCIWHNGLVINIILSLFILRPLIESINSPYATQIDWWVHSDKDISWWFTHQEWHILLWQYTIKVHNSTDI